MTFGYHCMSNQSESLHGGFISWWKRKKNHLKSCKSFKMCEPVFSRLRNLRSLRKQNFTTIQFFTESCKVKIPNSSGWHFIARLAGLEPGEECQMVGGGESGPGAPSPDTCAGRSSLPSREIFQNRRVGRNLVVLCKVILNPGCTVGFPGMLFKAMDAWALLLEILI